MSSAGRGSTPASSCLVAEFDKDDGQGVDRDDDDDDEEEDDDESDDESKSDVQVDAVSLMLPCGRRRKNGVERKRTSNKH